MSKNEKSYFILHGFAPNLSCQIEPKQINKLFIRNALLPKAYWKQPVLLKHQF